MTTTTKTPVTRTLALACSALLLSPIAAQSDKPSKALQRAIVIEEQERDLEQAAKAYRVVLDDAQASADARGEAAVRLGRVLQRLGRVEEARDVLATAAKGSSAEWAKRASALMQSSSKDVEAIRKRAREILAARPNHLGEQLRQLGPEAVPEIIAMHGAQWRAGDANSGRLAYLLWLIGGPAARKHVEEVAGRGEVAEVGAHLQAMHPEFAADMASVARLLLTNAAASDQVRVVALDAMRQRAPFDLILELADRGETEVMTRAWSLIRQRLSSLRRLEAKEEVLEQCVPAIRNRLQSLVLAEVVAVRGVLAGFGDMLPATRTMMLRTLPSWPRQLVINRYSRRTGSTSDREDILAAARALGPLHRNGATDHRPAWLDRVAQDCLTEWTREQLPIVAELGKLGYLDWVAWSQKRRIPLVEMFEAWDGHPSLLELLTKVKPEPIPAQAIDSMTRCWTALGRADRAQNASAFTMWVASTGHEDAGEWIDRMADGAAGHEDWVAAAALRRLLAVADTEDTRKRIRARLVAVKDPHNQHPAHELFGDMVGKGDATACEWIVNGEAKARGLRVLPSIELLSTNLVKSGSSALTRAQLVVAWGSGLRSGASSYLVEIGSWLHEQRAHREHALWKDLAPLATIAARDVLVKAEKLTDGQRDNVQRVAAVVCTATGADGPVSEPMDALLGAMFQEKQRFLLSQVLRFLQKRTVLEPKWRQKILDFANRGQGGGRCANYVRQNLTVSLGELKRLAAECPNGPSRAISTFLPVLELGQTEYVRSLLSRSGPTVQAAACAYLRRDLNPAAVPDLLRKLQSGSKSVREAATSALKAIRFHREQQDFWAKNGTSVDQSAKALSRLLKQAAPNQPKARRLLAIRGLAALRQPAALPSLIEWSAESDAQIATAAKAAIAALIAPGGEK